MLGASFSNRNSSFQLWNPSQKVLLTWPLSSFTLQTFIEVNAFQIIQINFSNNSYIIHDLHYLLFIHKNQYSTHFSSHIIINIAKYKSHFKEEFVPHLDGLPNKLCQSRNGFLIVLIHFPVHLTKHITNSDKQIKTRNVPASSVEEKHINERF